MYRNEDLNMLIFFNAACADQSDEFGSDDTACPLTGGPLSVSGFQLTCVAGFASEPGWYIGGTAHEGFESLLSDNTVQVFFPSALLSPDLILTGTWLDSSGDPVSGTAVECEVSHKPLFTSDAC